MKIRVTILLFMLAFAGSLFSQAISYEGPAEGRVDTGAINNTSLFEKFNPINPPKERVIKHKEDVDLKPIFIETGNTVIPESPYYNDISAVRTEGKGDTTQSVLVRSFQGIPMQNGIPPDPYIAVGPNHVIGIVNSRFAIWDKKGNQLASIDAEGWYNSVLFNNGAFDPKIAYDHFAERWIMVYLQQNDANTTSHLLLSVSDDSDPMGTWYSWALPGNKNGMTTTTNWTDYQGVGFDHQAIYITGNQFNFGGGFAYSKLRIIPKAQLYANTAGRVMWFDLWNIRYPGGIGGNPFGIRPTIAYDETTPYPLVLSPQGGGNFIAIYKVANPTTAPVLTGSYVMVQNFTVPPNANQLGGSTTLIDGGTTCQFRYEPMYIGGYLYTVHGINNPSASGYSAMRYYKIDVLGNSVSETATFGGSGFWYMYPTVAVDKSGNLAFSFSRSGTTEYAGAYYLTKPVGSTASTFESKLLAPGKGNYVLTYGGTRNRWGDYNGIWLDPETKRDFWIMAEYASATNQWGTWVGQVRVELEATPYLYSETQVSNFQPTEENTAGDTLEIKIKNMGAMDLVINNLSFTTNNFRIIDNVTYPLTLIPYEQTSFKVVFEPKSAGYFSDSLVVTSNATLVDRIEVNGRGFHILPVLPNGIYASTGSGKTYKFDPTNMSAGLLGNANFLEIKSIAINPKTNIIYGVVSADNNNRLVRVNADSGDAYEYMQIKTLQLSTLAFDSAGTLYGSTKNGILYRINLENKTVDSLFKIKCDVNSLAFDPITNELFGVIYRAIGSPRDRVFKVNMSTGDTTLLGVTGFNVLINDISFDGSGNLFGIKGGSSVPSDFFSINKETGAGTLIGSLGVNYVTSIEYAPGLTDVADGEVGKPAEFSLEQNYPNPFNPSTVIKYSLPEASAVKLVVYNLLGEVVKVLVDGFKNSGRHEVTFNTSDGGMTSGIYFYELRAKGNSGKEQREIKKMVLMK